MTIKPINQSQPLGSVHNTLKVAVVGSGPSGFYAAQALLDGEYHVEVDMLERLPTPFGLVRYGVAPDHVKLKSTTCVFTEIARDPRFRFWGNVTVGRDVTVKELRATFHAVVIATGSDGDRKLNITGENLTGVFAASKFIGWYNGNPGCASLSFDLQQETAVVIGQGNVAIDVCRLLTKPIDQLRKTDISSQALEVLATSRVRDVHLIGRRGPAQASFTPKEFRELDTMPGVQLIVDPNALNLQPTCEAELDLAGANASKARKNIALLRSVTRRSWKAGKKSIHLHFNQACTAFSGGDKLRCVHLELQALQGAPGAQLPQPTGITRTLETGLVFRSVGYRGRPLAGLPFDSSLGVIPNEKGRLSAETTDTTGLYVTGWIKRGPTGVIGTNRADSIETIEQLVKDLDCLNIDKPGRTHLSQIFNERALRVVTFNDWLRIERAERERGLAKGKSAEKFVNIDEMMRLVSRKADLRVQTDI